MIQRLAEWFAEWRPTLDAWATVIGLGLGALFALCAIVAKLRRTL